MVHDTTVARLGGRLVITGVVFFGLSVAGPAWAEPESRLNSDETVGQLLDDSARSANSETSQVTPLGLFLRLTGSVVGIVALGLALLHLARRFSQRGGWLPQNGPVQVMGRTSLSPRHSVYLVRIGDRKVAVGVSGENMTPLLVTNCGESDDANSSTKLPEESPRDDVQGGNFAEHRSGLFSRWKRPLPLVREE